MKDNPLVSPNSQHFSSVFGTGASAPAADASVLGPGASAPVADASVLDVDSLLEPSELDVAGY